MLCTPRSMRGRSITAAQLAKNTKYQYEFRPNPRSRWFSNLKKTCNDSKRMCGDEVPCDADAAFFSAF